MKKEGGLIPGFDDKLLLSFIGEREAL